METPTPKLNASKRLEIAVKITQLQANTPRDAKNNPFPRSKYHQIAFSVLGRKLPNSTLNRLLTDLGIEPKRSEASTVKEKEFISIRTRNVSEIKERLSLISTRIDSIEKHLASLEASLKS